MILHDTPSARARHADILGIYLRVMFWATLASLPVQYWLAARHHGEGLAFAITLGGAVVSFGALEALRRMVARGWLLLASRVVVGLLFVTCVAGAFQSRAEALGDAGLALSLIVLVVPVMVAGLLVNLREAMWVAVAATGTALIVPCWVTPSDPLVRWVPGLTLALIAQFPLLQAWAHRRDVREIEAGHAKLVAQDRLGTIGLMAASIAHDLRNPLGVVQLNVDLLAENQPEDARAECLADISDAVARMTLLVGDLGHYARADGGSSLGSSAPRVAAQAAVRLATASLPRGCAVGVDLQALPEVAMPEARLVQALTNLVVNAAHAVRPRSGPRIWLDGRIVGDAVEIAVNDNGPGVPDDVAARVFDAQFTTKSADEGSGLGLYICRTLVEERGGTIRVERSEAGGARFVLTVPIATNANE